MKFLIKILFCSPFFVILYNLIRYRSSVSVEFFKNYRTYRGYLGIVDENELFCVENVFRSCSCDECVQFYLFSIYFLLFSVGIFLILFNFWKFFGIFSVIFCLIFYYLILDADFFVFGMIGGLILLYYESDSTKILKNPYKKREILKNIEKNEKKTEKIENKIKIKEKNSEKNEEVVCGNASEDEIALKWKEYDEKYRPVRSKFRKFLENLKIPKKKVTRSLFPEFLMLTIVFCVCFSLVIVVNLLKNQ